MSQGFPPDLRVQRSSANTLRISSDGSTGAGNLEVTGTFLAGSHVTFADAANIVTNATTGTKIGTATGQKLGFWGATPVAQQVFATGASHTVDQLITVLQTLGLVKQS